MSPVVVLIEQGETDDGSQVKPKKSIHFKRPVFSVTRLAKNSPFGRIFLPLGAFLKKWPRIHQKAPDLGYFLS
jgi:hypothetical protein